MASNNAGQIRQALASMLERSRPPGGNTLSEYDMGEPMQGDPTATYSSYAQPTALGAGGGDDRELLRLLLQLLRQRRRPGMMSAPAPEAE